MPRLLQEALRFGCAGDEDQARPEDEGREVVSRLATNVIGAGLFEGCPAPLLSVESDRLLSLAHAGVFRNLAHESAEAECRFLRAPGQGEINPAAEPYHREVGRLATRRDRLDDPW